MVVLGGGKSGKRRELKAKQTRKEGEALDRSFPPSRVFCFNMTNVQRN